MNRDRRNQIVEMLSQQSTVKNTELMERFGISIETVRRDLAYLEEQGLLERVYGGAVKKTYLNTEPVYTSREKENEPEKRAIAREAVKLIQTNDTVFFDLGTTVLFLAQQIGQEQHLTAFTNAIRTAVVLSEVEGCEVIIPGGHLRSHELSVSGFLAEDNMRQFNVDKAFIGGAGITEQGITDFNIGEANLRRQIIRNARQVIVLADYSKFGIRAVSNVCPLEDIDVLITDAKAPADMLAALENSGVRVIVARQ